MQKQPIQQFQTPNVIQSPQQLRKRQPKSEPYQKVTTYTQKPSIHFILTIFLFLTQLIMHCIFIPRAIVKIDHSILYIIWGIMYLLLFIIAVDYIIITCNDPADGVLFNSSYNLKFKQRELRYCNTCLKYVHKNSYHCMRCNRCTEQFDHHCKYLNNCIGSRNYHPFLRILLIMIAYNLDILGQGIWVFISASNNYIINEAAFSRWVVLAIMIISFIILVAVSTLLGFHIYINCCISMTTIEYIYREKQENSEEKNKNQKKSNLKIKSIQKLGSAQNLKQEKYNSF